MSVQTSGKYANIKNFKDHVREYYPNDIDLFSQIAYMLDNDERDCIYPERISNAGVTFAAEQLVEGGTFLVYNDDVDEFGRETKLLDMRLTQQNRWESYCDRVERAICSICRNAFVSSQSAF